MSRSTARKKTGLLPDPNLSRPCLNQNSWHLAHARCLSVHTRRAFFFFEFVGTAWPRFLSGPPTLRQSHPVHHRSEKTGRKGCMRACFHRRLRWWLCVRMRQACPVLPVNLSAVSSPRARSSLLIAQCRRAWAASQGCLSGRIMAHRCAGHGFSQG